MRVGGGATGSRQIEECFVAACPVCCLLRACWLEAIRQLFSASCLLLFCCCFPLSLCLQGYALRNDINARLQSITKITTERYREHAAERKAKREVSSWAGQGGCCSGNVRWCQ